MAFFYDIFLFIVEFFSSPITATTLVVLFTSFIFWKIKCYCDLDGVLSNFDERILKFTEKNPSEHEPKETFKQPIFHKGWLEADYKEQLVQQNDYKIFKYKFEDQITGNIVQFGGGSNSGIWSAILSKMAKHLTVVDYAPNMIKVVKKTFKLNKYPTDNVTFVCERMEKYNTNLETADYVIFTYSLSFSNLPATIKNLTKHCKPGCKVIIAETLKPLLMSMCTNLLKDALSEQKLWKNNLLKIEGLFDENPFWKKTKKKQILRAQIPSMHLFYEKK